MVLDPRLLGLARPLGLGWGALGGASASECRMGNRTLGQALPWLRMGRRPLALIEIRSRIGLVAREIQSHQNAHAGPIGVVKCRSLPFPSSKVTGRLEYPRQAC